MSKRGPCKYCVWLFAGRICSSPEAERLEVSPSGRERLKHCLDNKVKEVITQFNRRIHRVETRIEWSGCFNGESDFSRKRGR